MVLKFVDTVYDLKDGKVIERAPVSEPSFITAEG
jgi:hypothetical protein